MCEMSEGGDPKRECECESELKVELERDHPSREEVEEASSHEEEDEDEDEGEGGDGSETNTNTSSDNDIVSVADTKLDFSEHHSHHSPHSHHSHHSGEEKAEELTNSFPIKLSANSEDFDSFFCHICYSHRTTQELTEEKDSAFTLSSCGHQYCLTCLQAYLESNILEGHTRIKCCCIADSEVLDDSGDVSNLDINTSDSENKATKIKFCEGFLTKVEVEQILINKIDHVVDPLLSSHPSAQSNAMVCQRPLCGVKYCFQHANAHPPSVTCEEYERSIASTLQASTRAIQLISKPCPGCGIYVSKTDGCNHMKCTNCQQCFCWVCGVAVEDSIFPNHFQWWNAMGCANMQMVEDVVPSRSSIIFARVTALAQTLVLGPISLVSTLISFILCFPCIYIHHTSSLEAASAATLPPSADTDISIPSDTPVSPGSEQSSGRSSPLPPETTPPSPVDITLSSKRKPFPWSQAVQGCMSGWGFFYLCVLILLPIAVALGVMFVSCWLVYVIGYILSYPIHYYSKKLNGETPDSFLKFFELRRRADAELDLESGIPGATFPSAPTPASPTMISASTNTTKSFGKNNDSIFDFTSVSTNDEIGEIETSSVLKIDECRKNDEISKEEELELQKIEGNMSPTERRCRKSGKHYTGHLKNNVTKDATIGSYCQVQSSDVNYGSNDNSVDLVVEETTCASNIADDKRINLMESAESVLADRKHGEGTIVFKIF